VRLRSHDPITLIRHTSAVNVARELAVALDLLQRQHGTVLMVASVVTSADEGRHGTAGFRSAQGGVHSCQARRLGMRAPEKRGGPIGAGGVRRRPR
jgi:hypothetical protein